MTTRKLQFVEEGPKLRVKSYKLSKTLRWCERLINCIKFQCTWYCSTSVICWELTGSADSAPPLPDWAQKLQPNNLTLTLLPLNYCGNLGGVVIHVHLCGNIGTTSSAGIASHLRRYSSVTCTGQLGHFWNWSWQTTDMWKTTHSAEGPTLQCNWPCQSRPPVLRPQFYGQWDGFSGLSRQVLLYCITSLLSRRKWSHRSH